MKLCSALLCAPITVAFAAETDSVEELRRLFVSFSGNDDALQSSTRSSSMASGDATCPEACTTCRAGRHFGGEQLINGVCTHYCSMAKYCGSSMMYRNTDCAGCVQSGTPEPEVSVGPVSPANPSPAQSSVSCSDVEDFVDKDGRSCNIWNGYDCRNHYGWSQEEVDGLLTSCAKSCNSCGYVPMTAMTTPASLPTESQTTQESHEHQGQQPSAQAIWNCPERCQSCKDGKRVGGAELMGGVCTHHCSMAGYCGKNMMFRNTNCSSCAQFGEDEWHSPTETAGGEEDTQADAFHNCPARCQSCKPGNRFGGKELENGVCTHQCSWTGHCGTGVMYKRTNCEACAGYAFGFEDENLISASAVVKYSMPIVLVCLQSIDV